VAVGGVKLVVDGIVLDDRVVRLLVLVGGAVVGGVVDGAVDVVAGGSLLVGGVADREPPRVSTRSSPHPVTSSVTATSADMQLPAVRALVLVESICPPHR
jgi:hypothetical protein